MTEITTRGTPGSVWSAARARRAIQGLRLNVRTCDLGRIRSMGRITGLQAWASWRSTTVASIRPNRWRGPWPHWRCSQTDREPLMLFPELVRRGYSWSFGSARDGQHYVVRITRGLLEQP